MSPLLVADETVFANNADWLSPLKYIPFLRDIGRHFSVNRMLSAESYKRRLATGLSFIEFNYQLLQAYDFLELNKRYGCRLQLGGDDQWGNILAGVDLCRRVQQQEVFGLTLPLLLTATGEKMGKTATGAVWLDAERVSPFEYYQYWVNVQDADVVRMLGYFTFLPMQEIEYVRTLAGGPMLNAAKSILAYETTAILHGKEAAESTHAAALGAFGNRQIPDDLLPSSSVPRYAAGLVQEIPSTRLSSVSGMILVDLLVQSGLAASKKQARRLIEQGGVRVNDEKAANVEQTLTRQHFIDGALLLRSGKKKLHRFLLG
jgi:tyrosyl-tRNA synthetase